MAINGLEISLRIEELLVARNPRHMKVAQAALTPGYYWRAASLLHQAIEQPGSTVLIMTGFPIVLVNGQLTFETDGPVGAIVLYQALSALKASPVLVVNGALADALTGDYQLCVIDECDAEPNRIQIQTALSVYEPAAIISIEVPGVNHRHTYCNMRGDDIGQYCLAKDSFFTDSTCPTIAIGDGGNEIGMGNIAKALEGLNIVPSVTKCDELLVADVSNWGAYGLLACLSLLARQNLLAALQPRSIVDYLLARGAVDGITRASAATEDGYPCEEAEALIAQLQKTAGLTSWIDES